MRRRAPLGLHLEPPGKQRSRRTSWRRCGGSWRSQYGVEEVHGAGLRVYTTLDLDLQQVAKQGRSGRHRRPTSADAWMEDDGCRMSCWTVGDVDTYRHPGLAAAG